MGLKKFIKLLLSKKKVQKEDTSIRLPTIDPVDPPTPD